MVPKASSFLIDIAFLGVSRLSTFRSGGKRWHQDLFKWNTWTMIQIALDMTMGEQCWGEELRIFYLYPAWIGAWSLHRVFCRDQEK